MSTFKDLTGMTFGELTVIKRVENNKHNQVQYLCKCSCSEDKFVVVVGGKLSSGHTKSCGHLQGAKMPDVNCKVCGKSSVYDKHFNKLNMLCNRHYTQYKIYGKYLDTECIINSNRKNWSKDEIDYVISEYSKGTDMHLVAKRFDVSYQSVMDVLTRNGIEIEIRYKNDSRFKAVYQEYDWCYERYVIKRMSYEEMAAEAGTTPRTIAKWCSEKHRLNAHTLRKELHLTDKQKELIMFSLLGDGHIDKRESQPLFIVCHAVNQKDYLFWKYDILKNVCNQEPTLYTGISSTFGSGKTYKCQDFYRFCTKILDDLYSIRAMSKSEIISQLNETGLSIHLLDDGSNSEGFWNLCYASFTQEEKELYCKILQERFDITPHLLKDDRYIGFSKIDSQKINEIILRNIPNNLDIIQYKILKEKTA